MSAGQRSGADNVQAGFRPRSADGRPSAAAPWTTTLECRVAEADAHLSASRKRLIREILEHPEDTYFLSSRALAKHYNVNTATIVRTVQALGYDRFADFAADLRSHFVTRITPYAVMKSTAREKRSIADHINHSLEMDERNLHALHSSLEVARVTELAKRVHRARRILVVGIDFAACLSTCWRTPWCRSDSTPKLL